MILKLGAVILIDRAESNREEWVCEIFYILYAAQVFVYTYENHQPNAMSCIRIIHGECIEFEMKFGSSVQKRYAYMTPSYKRAHSTPFVDPIEYFSCTTIR